MNELYRRAMGLHFDEERLVHEAANGLSGHGLEADADVDESSAGEMSEVMTSEYGSALQDTRLALYEAELSFEERIVLEAEEVVLAEQVRLEELALENPIYTSVLQEWLLEELRILAIAGVPIDDEMYTEARVLGEFIAEANDDADDSTLIEIAKEMKALIEAQHHLHDIQEYFALAS